MLGCGHICVNSLVDNKVAYACELPSADITLVWIIFFVNSLVDYKIPSDGKLLVTQITPEWLLFSVISLLLNLALN